MKSLSDLLPSSEPETQAAICEEHGDYESRHVFGRIWTKCPTCAADAREKQRREDEARDRAKRVMAWQSKIGGAGIPERFLDRRLGTFVARSDDQRRALAFAQDYADTFDEVLATGRCALFIGRPGTGKTHLAVGVGMQIMESGYTALFQTVMRAVRRVKDTWRRDSQESETAAIAAMVFPDLLILDEVGVQFSSDAERLILFDILNERYEKRKPTLFLSNLTTDEVKACLGERVFDRLREDGGEVVPFGWESHRGKEVA
ncbi:ATP-binding protein [Burkholderia multivorans]|nr:ATP-binding protein [Burkholderia multivorans]